MNISITNCSYDFKGEYIFKNYQIVYFKYM